MFSHISPNMLFGMQKSCYTSLSLCLNRNRNTLIFYYVRICCSYIWCCSVIFDQKKKSNLFFSDFFTSSEWCKTWFWHSMWILTYFFHSIIFWQYSVFKNRPNISLCSNSRFTTVYVGKFVFRSMLRKWLTGNKQIITYP